MERREDDGAQSRYDRQRNRRKAVKGKSVSSGCATIELHGTDEQQAEMWGRIAARADEFYESDGGRDVPDAEHPRTHMQRLFDAAYELIMQQPSAGTVTNNRAPSPKQMLHVTLTVDEEAEALIRAACPNGHGYLPESVLERYGCGAMLGGTVFNQRGEILWYGRKRRLASPAQFEALIMRDGGCVLCGADASRCQAHHLQPFGAPVEGETNIDEMALVCTSCHTWIHDSKRTLYYLVQQLDSSKRASAGARGSPPKLEWRTRSATPEEIAPSRQPALKRRPGLAVTPETRAKDRPSAHGVGTPARPRTPIDDR